MRIKSVEEKSLDYLILSDKFLKEYRSVKWFKISKKIKLYFDYKDALYMFHFFASCIK